MADVHRREGASIVTAPKGKQGVGTQNSVSAPVEGVVRRTRRKPFIAPLNEDATPAVSRELASRKPAKPQISRNRRIAGDLPDWDPLPPGEIVVARHRA
jgi:hypothetical protein